MLMICTLLELFLLSMSFFICTGMELNPCIIVHHGGSWEMENELVYIGGAVKMFQDLCNYVTLSDVKNMISSLGYNNIVKLHYLDPRKELSNGVRFLGYESNLFDPFLALLLKHKVIHVYT